MRGAGIPGGAWCLAHFSDREGTHGSVQLQRWVACAYGAGAACLEPESPERAEKKTWGQPVPKERRWPRTALRPQLSRLMASRPALRLAAPRATRRWHANTLRFAAVRDTHGAGATERDCARIRHRGAAGLPVGHHALRACSATHGGARVDVSNAAAHRRRRVEVCATNAQRVLHAAADTAAVCAAARGVTAVRRIVDAQAGTRAGESRNAATELALRIGHASAHRRGGVEVSTACAEHCLHAAADAAAIGSAALRIATVGGVVHAAACARAGCTGETAAGLFGSSAAIRERLLTTAKRLLAVGECCLLLCLIWSGEVLCFTELTRTNAGTTQNHCERNDRN
jgi:hypothetical protein